MEKIRIVLTVTALCACLSLQAAAGSLSGRVTGEDGPLAGVNILVQGTARGASTNAAGEYRIADLPAGTYTVVYSLIGYQRVVRRGVIVEEGGETTVNVAMTQAPVQTEQIVVTANKREQSLQDVPVSVSVLDATAISQRNAVSIDEALRYIPGVTITGLQVNIRGSSGYSLGAGSRVLMLIDGIPFIAGDTGEINFESIPMGQVERIEVVKGASSVLYGSSALGGVINIITKPIPEAPVTTLRAFGGIYSQFPAVQWRWTDSPRLFHGQSINHSRRAGDLGISLFVSHQSDDGYRQNDYRQRYNFLMKMREDFSPSASLTMNFGLAHQYAGQFLYWRNIDSALIPPLRHESDNTKATRYYLSGIYNNALSDRVLFTTKALWYHNNWGFQQSGQTARTESQADGFRLEGLTSVVLSDMHTLTLGLDGNVDIIGGDMFARRVIGGLAVYGQEEARILEDLTLTLGARFDFQSVGLTGDGGRVNPKAGLTFRPFAGTTMRASFGTGFRVPSLPEAFIAAGSSGLMAIPNKDLKPEKSYSYEVGLTKTLGTNGTFDVAAFRSDISNLIEPGLIISGTGIEIQWRNVVKARVQGVETSLAYALFNGAVVPTIGYTYVYPQDRTRHDILKYRPRHQLYANLRAQVGWMNAGVDFRYVSRMERIDQELVDTGTIPDGDARVPIYVTDFRLGADLSGMGLPLSMTFSTNNAFQHRYVELIGNIMPPRNYVLVIEARL